MGGTRGGIGGSRRSGARARLGRALRRSYRWVLREAETRTGAAAMVALSFTGSAFVPIFLEPPLILLTSGLPNLWRRFALLFAAGSVLGGVATYVIGYAFVETVGLAVIRFWGAEASWAHLMELAQGRWGFAAVAAIALGPGPYKLVTMAAGATQMPFLAFFGILTAGRSLRFLAVAWLTRAFGSRVRGWLRRVPAPAMAAAAVALALVGLAVYLLAIRLAR